MLLHLATSTAALFDSVDFVPDMDRPRKPPPAPLGRLRGGGKPLLLLSPGRMAKIRRADTTPLPWDGCFDECVHVNCNDGEDNATFVFYMSGLTDENDESKPVLLLLHGGGCSALSFAALARHLRGHNLGIVALDQRGHGLTKTSDDGALDIDTLVGDAVSATRALFTAHLKRSIVPPLVICGHSVGGSVAARVAVGKQLPIIATILIDVTEGTALQALPQMASWVTSRPASFSTQADAVRYVCSRGNVRNLQSARLSVPSQLRQLDDGKGRWIWRTDLAATQPHWSAWFTGLSGIFLSVPGPKLLILAGVDRLDKSLTIAQMQGKFQNILIPDAGHSIHEDQPDKTAAAITDFLYRNLIIGNQLNSPVTTNGPVGVFQQRNPVVTTTSPTKE